MKVKLENFEQVVNEERAVQNLRLELKRIFGESVNVDGNLNEIATNVNDRLVVLELLGRPAPRIKVSKIVPFFESKDIEIKQMVKKLAPRRNVNEAKEEPERILNVALGDDSKQYSLDLSEEWYRQKAADLINDYSKHRTLDNSWQDRAVSNFCNHTKATSGVVIDRDKLFEAVNDLMEERDEATIELDTMFSLRSPEASLTESVKQPTIDPVQELEESYTNEKFVKLFNVQTRRAKSLNENLTFKNVPVRATLPADRDIRDMDERVIDKFVNNWNSRRSMKDEPYRMSWQTADDRNVEFKVRKL